MASTYNTAQESATPRDPEFQAALKKLSSINARLGELSAIAGQGADKIVGSMPTPLNPAEKDVAPTPNNYLADLSRSLSQTSDMVERIYRNVTRITNEF